MGPDSVAAASVERRGPGFGYGRGEAVVRGAPTYNGAALSSQVSPGSGTVFCRSCGKPIEADARFCRFCGKSQAEPAGRRAASTPRLEDRLQQLFPRHPLQDEFMHIGSIAAFFMALIGFVLGLFTPAMGGPWLSVNFLLGSVALLLFLMLRQSTLSHIRPRADGPTATEAGTAGRQQAGRRGEGASAVSTEAATAESSPPR